MMECSFYTDLLTWYKPVVRRQLVAAVQSGLCCGCRMLFSWQNWPLQLQSSMQPAWQRWMSLSAASILTKRCLCSCVRWRSSCDSG